MERLALIAANDVPLSPREGVAAFGERFMGVTPHQHSSNATSGERTHYPPASQAWKEYIMGLGIIGWLIIGIVAGWLAEKVMGRNHGLITNLIVGVLGAFLGGWIAGALLHIPVGGFNIVTLIVAFGGACLLLFLLGLVKRRA
jgi:uncharacterized membrane protein YeaQ/YmgE (transglycosylase-associated protein family)